MRLRSSVLVLSLLICNVAFPLMVDTTTLYPDGSALKDAENFVKDPGDRVTVELYFGPKDEAVQVKVLPVLAGGEGLNGRERVKAKAGAALRDGEGLLSVVRKVTGEPGEATYRKENFDFPYAQFDLAPGKYNLYYEVEVSYPDKREEETEVYKTGVSTVDIGARGARATITVAEVVPPTYLPKEVVAYTSDSQEPNGYKEIKVEVKKLEKTGAIKGQGAKTNIPGNFRRDASADKAGAFTPTLKPDAYPVIGFATTRTLANAAAKDLDARFAAKFANKLNYGNARVSIPVKYHKKGELEAKTLFTRDPEKYFFIDVTNDVTAENFFPGYRDTDVLVFVHGYNTTLGEAVLRAAQIQYDIRFPGRTLVFSFPSQGALILTLPPSTQMLNAYGQDQENADKSVPLLEKFLTDLVIGSNGLERTGGRVHIVAHSMGTMMTQRALAQLALKSPHFAKGKRPIASLTLAAPDITLSEFASNVPYLIENAAQKVTYYYSDKDVPLRISQIKNGTDRAGRHPYFHTGMTTICADNENSPFITAGHTYVGARPRMLLDLHLAMVLDLMPDKRHPPLTEKEELKNYPGHAHYSFVPLTR